MINNLENIPKEFTIAGGKLIKVEIVDYLKDGERFGEFNDASGTITLAKSVKIDGNSYIQTPEDIYRTYLHELIHCFQFYSGMSYDEMVAQVFSNFIYEYKNTKS